MCGLLASFYFLKNENSLRVMTNEKKNSILYRKNILFSCMYMQSVNFVLKPFAYCTCLPQKAIHNYMRKILKKQLIQNHEIDYSNTVEIFCRLKKSTTP